jgi:hypothetical protein
LTNEKNLISTFLFVFNLSCDKSDDIPNIQECLVCASFIETVDVFLQELNGFCLGTTGESLSTGAYTTLTLLDIQAYAFFKVLVASCSVE